MAFALATAVLSSCMKDIDYDVAKDGTKMVLNAQWYTTDTLHYVYLCRSTAAHVTDVEEDLVVSCFVNGVPAEMPDDSWVVESAIGDPKLFMSRCYPVKATIKAGDEIVLKADSDSCHISAKVTVPPPPEVTVDTSSVYIVDAEYRDRIYDFTVHLKDNPGENNYYRAFSLQGVSNEYRRKSDTVPHETRYYYVALDESDPVFKSIPVQLPGSMEEKSSNPAHVFSDELFQGGEYIFRFSMEDHPLILSGRTGCERYVPEVYIRMASISWDTYLYCLSSNAMDMAGFGSLSEPAIIHENVEGGMGNFSVYSVTEHHIYLHGWEFDLYNQNTNL